MISRYTRDEMASIWTDEARLTRWLEVEILACEAWAALGKIPKKSLRTIKSKAGFDVARVAKVEAALPPTLHLLGNHLHGIGIPALVRLAHGLAEAHRGLNVRRG